MKIFPIVLFFFLFFFFGTKKRESGLDLISYDCSLRLSSSFSSSSAAAHYQKTHTHLSEILYFFSSSSLFSQTGSCTTLKLHQGSCLGIVFDILLTRRSACSRPGPIKAVESSAFCLWSVVRITVQSRLGLMINDGKALHMRKRCFCCSSSWRSMGRLLCKLIDIIIIIISVVWEESEI